MLHKMDNIKKGESREEGKAERGNKRNSSLYPFGSVRERMFPRATGWKCQGDHRVPREIRRGTANSEKNAMLGGNGVTGKGMIRAINDYKGGKLRRGGGENGVEIGGKRRRSGKSMADRRSQNHSGNVWCQYQ